MSRCMKRVNRRGSAAWEGMCDARRVRLGEHRRASAGRRDETTASEVGWEEGTIHWCQAHKWLSASWMRWRKCAARKPPQRPLTPARGCHPDSDSSFFIRFNKHAQGKKRKGGLSQLGSRLFASSSNSEERGRAPESNSQILSKRRQRAQCSLSFSRPLSPARSSSRSHLLFTILSHQSLSAKAYVLSQAATSPNINHSPPTAKQITPRQWLLLLYPLLP